MSQLSASNKIADANLSVDGDNKGVVDSGTKFIVNLPVNSAVLGELEETVNKEFQKLSSSFVAESAVSIQRLINPHYYMYLGELEEDQRVAKTQSSALSIMNPVEVVSKKVDGNSHFSGQQIVGKQKKVHDNVHSHSHRPSRKSVLKMLPTTVEKRNARERTRVHTVNEAFHVLKRCLPQLKSNTKRVSKLKILKAAVNYIYSLINLSERNTSPVPSNNIRCKANTTSKSNSTANIGAITRQTSTAIPAQNTNDSVSIRGESTAVIRLADPNSLSHTSLLAINDPQQLLSPYSSSALLSFPLNGLQNYADMTDPTSYPCNHSSFLIDQHNRSVEEIGHLQVGSGPANIMSTYTSLDSLYYYNSRPLAAINPSTFVNLF